MKSEMLLVVNGKYKRLNKRRLKKEISKLATGFIDFIYDPPYIDTEYIDVKFSYGRHFLNLQIADRGRNGV